MSVSIELNDIKLNNNTNINNNNNTSNYRFTQRNHNQKFITNNNSSDSNYQISTVNNNNNINNNKFNTRQTKNCNIKSNDVEINLENGKNRRKNSRAEQQDNQLQIQLESNLKPQQQQQQQQQQSSDSDCNRFGSGGADYLKINLNYSPNLKKKSLSKKKEASKSRNIAKKNEHEQQQQQPQEQSEQSEIAKNTTNVILNEKEITKMINTNNNTTSTGGGIKIAVPVIAAPPQQVDTEPRRKSFLKTNMLNDFDSIQENRTSFSFNAVNLSMSINKSSRANSTNLTNQSIIIESTGNFDQTQMFNSQQNRCCYFCFLIKKLFNSSQMDDANGLSFGGAYVPMLPNRNNSLNVTQANLINKPAQKVNPQQQQQQQQSAQLKSVLTYLLIELWRYLVGILFSLIVCASFVSTIFLLKKTLNMQRIKPTTRQTNNPNHKTNNASQNSRSSSSSSSSSSWIELDRVYYNFYHNNYGEFNRTAAGGDGELTYGEDGPNLCFNLIWLATSLFLFIYPIYFVFYFIRVKCRKCKRAKKSKDTSAAAGGGPVLRRRKKFKFKQFLFDSLNIFNSLNNSKYGRNAKNLIYIDSMKKSNQKSAAGAPAATTTSTTAGSTANGALNNDANSSSANNNNKTQPETSTTATQPPGDSSPAIGTSSTPVNVSNLLNVYAKKDYLFKIVIITTLWLSTGYFFLKAIDILYCSDVVILFSINFSFIYMIKWIFLHNLFIPLRLLGVIFSIAALIFIYYSEGFSFNMKFFGNFCATTSAAGCSILKIIWEYNTSNKKIYQRLMFLSLIGLCCFVVGWPLMIFLELINAEKMSIVLNDFFKREYAMENLYSYLGATLFAFIYVFSLKFGSLVTREGFLQFGCVLCIPAALTLDLKLNKMNMSNLKIGAFFCVSIGYIFLILPENLYGDFKKQFFPESNDVNNVKSSLTRKYKYASPTSPGHTQNLLTRSAAH